MGTTTSKVSTTSLTALPGKLSGAQGALAGITSGTNLLDIRLNSAILTDKLTADVLGKVLMANDTLDPQGWLGGNRRRGHHWCRGRRVYADWRERV